MKRPAAYGLIAVLVAALIGAAGWGVAWLATTTDGVRWLMDGISRHTALKISAREIEGRLLDRLQLRGVHVALAPVEMGMENLDFRWQPLSLLSGRAAVKELSLTGVDIRDNTPEERPPNLTWPRVSVLATFFDVGIYRLRVKNLTYRRLAGPPVSVTSISSSMSWQSALLSLPDLTLLAPSGSLSGGIAVGFSPPSIQFDLALTTAAAVAGMDAFSLHGKFLPGRGPEQLAGDFGITGLSGRIKRLELGGEAGVTGTGFNLRRLKLNRPATAGRLTGGGAITLAAGEPRLAFQFEVAGLDLAPELGAPTDISGTLTLSGTPSLYRGQTTLVNQGSGWRMVRLSAPYQGDRAGVKMAPLRGTLLSGSLQGDLEVRWRDGIALEGTMSGRGLNPAGIDPDWTGVVNFDLTAKGAWLGDTPPRGTVAGKLRESWLHGQSLSGELRADFARGDLRIDRLALEGKGFSITAVGELGKRLSVAARVGELGRLIPRTAGELLADGWVRWRDGHLAGAATGRGADLAAGGLRVAAADLSAQFGEEKGALPHIAVAFRNLAYEGFRADSLTLKADGTAQQHSVNALLHAGGAEARATLAGSFFQRAWQGEIVRFSGRDGIGPWDSEAPAALSVAADRIVLAPFVITGMRRERLEIAGDLTAKESGGSARVAWSGLDIARVNPWLSEVQASGTSAGTVTLQFPKGEPAALSGTARATGTLAMKGYGITVREASLALDGNEKGARGEMELRLAGGGMVKGAFSSPAPARLSIPETGKVSAEWIDLDLTPIRRWLPGNLALAGRVSGRVSGDIVSGERLGLAGKVSLSQGKIGWHLGKGALDATVSAAELEGSWQGGLRGAAPEAGRLILAGRAAGAGVLILEGQRIRLDRIAAGLEEDERGLRAKMDLSLAGGGTVKGRFSSPRAPDLAIPDQGEMDIEWTGIDLSLLRPWLPGSLILEGRLAGRASGALVAGQRFALKGDTALPGGRIRWVRPEGEIEGTFRSASLSWDWRGEELRGTAVVALAERGEVRGGFRLPLPASLPIALNRAGPFQASLAGRVREQGILTALLPELIQESQGEIDTDLRFGGTWEIPRMEGRLKLAGAGAYLPTAGIHVRGLELAARLEDDLIRIDSFRALSDPGHIEGAALVRLKGWEVVGYQGSIRGERFRSVYLPELQILSSPNLTFEGAPGRLNIRGEVRLPEFIVISQPARQAVQPSRDVVLDEAPKSAVRHSPLALDAQLRIVLGERVLAKVEGIDAQLGGSIDLAFRDLDKITSKGEIRVVKGRYKAYGVDLDIARGRLFYSGGPLNQPILDILAIRTIGDVHAGVTAGGILRAPVIKLYSEPAMPDVDTLAYIVFGHPLGTGSGEQAAMMAQVAGALLSRGQSFALQEQIKNRLGLSTLELQTAGDAAGRSGYKQIPVAPAGVAQARQAGGISQTMLTVGKYLTPRLYFSYGRSLFTGGNLFRLRYDIFKQWQIETQTGSESGVDLYYRIDFD